MTKPSNELTLAEAVDQIYYGASCEDCHEVRKIDLHKLLADLGPDFMVGDIMHKLKCQQCGGKNIITAKLRKDATSTERLMERWK